MCMHVNADVALAACHGYFTIVSWSLTQYVKISKQRNLQVSPSLFESALFVEIEIGVMKAMQANARTSPQLLLRRISRIMLCEEHPLLGFYGLN